MPITTPRHWPRTGAPDVRWAVQLGYSRDPKRLGLSCAPRSYTKPLTSAQG
ncbi:MAG: hypothetical protein ABW135_02670 [Thermoleophilaceae bacterium]